MFYVFAFCERMTVSIDVATTSETVMVPNALNRDPQTEGGVAMTACTHKQSPYQQGPRGLEWARGTTSPTVNSGVWSSGLAWLLGVALLGAPGTAEATGHTIDTAVNVVFILADDLGYGDVRAMDPDSTLPTPHIDSLVTDGMQFTDAHSPSSVCTPIAR